MMHFTGEEAVKSTLWKKPESARRYFIGGSDARIIMGDDEAALLRLWREKRAEIEPYPTISSFSLASPPKT